MINKQPIDSLIFDMDGTLWDAVDSYATIWNVTLDEEGIPHQPVTRQELLSLMGSYLDDILKQLIPNLEQRSRLLERVMVNEANMMPTLGGILYPDVKRLIPILAKKYRLFMVSNCGAEGLENFVQYNGLQGYFTDLLSHGGTGKSKTENIQTLINKYGLKSPVYVGDTQSDANSAMKAGVPMIWTAYGFGHVSDPDATIHRFAEIENAVAEINAKIAAWPTTFNLLPKTDLEEKLSRLRSLMADNNLDTLFIADNANKYYLTGRIFSGYILITADTAHWFVRRPTIFTGDGFTLIRKVENIADHIETGRLGRIGFETTLMPYADIQRFAKALGTTDIISGDSAIMSCRAVKTYYEILKIEQSSDCLSKVYSLIPSMYQEGMTDVDLQIAIEMESRRQGCIGIFRINGQEMELNMGSVLVGNNADNPSPYDFAMGGEGQDPSLPVGANGTPIRPGNTVMVDTNGDFSGYMTDMTRTFACGDISDEAKRAHNLSIAICERLAGMGKPGTKAADLYNEALSMATSAGLADRFMGHRSQAGFVGHGVGIAINEAPVLAPRSRDILQKGNVIAIEPKFVIDGTGAVGVENTYVVTETGMRRLTHAPQELILLK